MNVQPPLRLSYLSAQEYKNIIEQSITIFCVINNAENLVLINFKFLNINSIGIGQTMTK